MCTVYRVVRKVKHLVGGSAALHGSRVGFSKYSVDIISKIT